MGDAARPVAGVGALLLASVLGLGVPAGAGADPVVVTAPGAVAVPIGSTSAVPGGVVNGFPPTESVRLVVSVGSGTLSLPNAVAAVTVPFGYPALGAPGPKLAVEGVQDDVNAALAALRWTPADRGTTSLTVDATPAGAAYAAETGHYYQVVSAPAPVSWDQARAVAAASSFNGLSGYLATITTPAEADLLTQTTPDPAWIGATDVNGGWQWATGPEAGTPLTFAAWDVGQPDGAAGHDVAVFGGVERGGRWHSTAVADPTVSRYLVEYGGPNQTAAEEGHASTTLAAIVPPGAPTGVQVGPGPGVVTVAWQPPADDGGAAPSAYVVTGTPSGSCLATAPALSCTVESLSNATTYRFRVAALNDAGTGPSSEESAPIALGNQNPGVTPAETTPPPSTTTTPTVVPSAPPLAVEPTLPPPTTTEPDTTVAPPETTAPPITTSVSAAPTRVSPATTTVPPATTRAPSASSPTTVATTPTTSASTTTTTTTPPRQASGVGGGAVYIVFDVGVGTKLADARLTVRGLGLRPGSSVVVTAHSTPVVLATVTVGPTGTIKWDGPLPADLGDGDHTVDVLATGADGTAVGRVSSFALANGVLTRIGAAVPDTPPKPASTPATATTTGRAAPTSAAPDSGGGGSSIPWLPVLAVVSVAGSLVAVWRRRQRAPSGRANPPTVGTPASDDAAPARARTTTPRRRARSRRRAAPTRAASSR
jgi:hypothetical protein